MGNKILHLLDLAFTFVGKIAQYIFLLMVSFVWLSFFIIIVVNLIKIVKKMWA